MTNELKTLRANIMGGMNAYVLKTVEDKNNLNFWWTYGLPNKVTEEMLADYAEDDELWLKTVTAFADVLRMNNSNTWKKIVNSVMNKMFED